MTWDFDAALMGVGYGLLFAWILRAVAASPSFSWASTPLLLAAFAYSVSFMKVTTSDKDAKSRYGQLQWFSWVTYYAISLTWGLPLHWYDILIVTALVSDPESPLTSFMLATYYLLSAAQYAEAEDAVQVSARLVLLVAFARLALRQYTQYQDANNNIKSE